MKLHQFSKGLALAGAWLLIVSMSAAAAEKCSMGFVCVEPERVGDQLHFIARNLKAFPITVTMETRTSGLRALDSREATKTVPPAQSMIISRYAVRSANYDYRYWFDWTVGELRPSFDQDHVYQLPFAPGQRVRVLQGFGSRFSHRNREHYAVDFDVRTGTPVHAARGGVVARVVEKHNRGCWEKGCGRYANFIVIVHPDGTTGEYYHLMQNGSVVEEGDRVVQGQHIGFSGNTGHTTMPHLHFAVYKAVSWGRTQSLPFQLRTAERVVDRPRGGDRYRVPVEPLAE